MKQTIRYTILSFILAVLVVPTVAPLTVFAAATDPGSGGGGTSVTCKKDQGVNVGTTNAGDCAEKTAFSYGVCKQSGVTISCLASEILRFLSVIVGILVVGGIIVGGITYSTGSGNAAKTQKGVTIIINSVLGLVLYLLMFALINFLVPGGVIG